MDTQRLELLSQALYYAKKHEAGGNIDSAQENISAAVLDLVSLAVMGCGSRDEGIAYMRSQGGLDLIAKCEELTRRLPESEQVPIFILIGVAHVGSLLGRHDTAEYFVARAQYSGRHFWDEYARAIQCLVTKHSYEPHLGKLGGSQRYWAAYLPFISDITNGRDLAGSLLAMSQSFQKRQSDKRITDDGGLIVEGSAKQPTHWDFRADAIKAYATHKYGLTFLG